MRVSPISYSYSRIATQKTNSPETTTRPNAGKVAFGHIGKYVEEVKNYKDCFNRAYTYDVFKKSHFKAAFERLTFWVKTVARVPKTEFSSNFESMLYDAQYGKEVERINGLAIFAREKGTNSILVFGDPVINSIKFLPPGNDYNPAILEEKNIPSVEFSIEGRDSDYVFTTFRLLPNSDIGETKFTKIWNSTGEPKEIFRGVNGYVDYDRYYNRDGSENALKNFFYGT